MNTVTPTAGAATATDSADRLRVAHFDGAAVAADPGRRRPHMMIVRLLAAAGHPAAERPAAGRERCPAPHRAS
ncbi:hypothetical protein ACWC0A_34525 [Streptomyces scopuliridis]